MDMLCVVLAELHPEADLSREGALVDGGILDSFDIITLVDAMDEYCGVRVSARDLTPENFNSLDAMRSLVQRLREA